MIHNFADGKSHYGLNWCLDESGLETFFRVPIIRLTIYFRIRSEKVMKKLAANPSDPLDCRRVIFDAYFGDKVYG